MKNKENRLKFLLSKVTDSNLLDLKLTAKGRRDMQLEIRHSVPGCSDMDSTNVSVSSKIPLCV